MTVQPTTLVILGASGDLTSRLLLPGLGTLLRDEPTRSVRVVGADRAPMEPEAWRERVVTSLQTDGHTEVPSGLAGTDYVRVDAMDPDEFPRFVAGLPQDAVLYFALPPTVTLAACKLLVGATLPPGLRLALEKPFGHDRASAHELNGILAGLVPEDRTYRVDHFLGEATLLNLLGLRFTNRVFEPVWNAANIERVEIIADETIALEGRAGYYDKAGALIDMLQSHLLQMLAMFSMEEPSRIDHVEVRDMIAHVLRSTSIKGGDPRSASRRARYTAGREEDEDVPDYIAEKGVDPARKTETLAEVVVEVDNSRWAGVPFLLRSGKALDRTAFEIVAHFRPVAHQPQGFLNHAPHNVLAIGMVPESLKLVVSTNAGGNILDLEPTVFSADLGHSPLRQYGEILAHIFDNNPLLSVRGDIAEQCWRIVEPVLDAWRADEVVMDTYQAGSSGPPAWSARPLQ